MVHGIRTGKCFDSGTAAVPCALHVTLSRLIPVIEQLMDDIAEIEARVCAMEGRVQVSAILMDEVLTVEEMERRLILAAMSRHGGNHHAVAVELGIHKRTIERKLIKIKAGTGGSQ